MTTSMIVERWHRVLKENFLESRQNNRIDYLVNTLISSCSEIVTNHQVNDERGFSEASSRKNINTKSHNISLSAFLSCTATPTGWIIKTKRGEATVTKLTCTCDAQNNVHCAHCQACPYELACDCATASAAGRVCAHLQIVQTKFRDDHSLEPQQLPINVRESSQSNATTQEVEAQKESTRAVYEEFSACLDQHAAVGRNLLRDAANPLSKQILQEYVDKFKTYDFILLKSESDVVNHKPSISPAEESEPFTLAGFGNDTGYLSYLPGSIHSVRRHYFSGLGPCILGTSRSSSGDSGGGVWGSRGLIGMNIGCTIMPRKNHQEAISEATIFSPKNIISPAVEFEKAYMEELEIERKETKSPPNKKSCLVTVIDGCTLYGAFA